MYWLVSLPGGKNQGTEDVWRAVQAKTHQLDLSRNHKFELPMNLRVGSLDKLMVMSDDLSRVDLHVEQVVNKIRRQATETAPETVLNVNNRPVSSYITSFRWDEAKYSLHKPLPEIVEELSQGVTSVDEELKVKLAEYQGTKQVFQAAARKTGGSLAIKDLRTILSNDLLISTENMTTAVVTVPNHGVVEFMKTYETWCDKIVPRSAVKVAEDAEYTLMRVIVFRKVLDDFKTAARAQQCQTREYDPKPDESGAELENPEEVTEKCRSELEECKMKLGDWCKTAFSEAFAAWIHICAVRLFVESVLRYGLPPKFLGMLVKPEDRHQHKVRKCLAESMDSDTSSLWTEGGSGTEGDMFPYVSFTLDIES